MYDMNLVYSIYVCFIIALIAAIPMFIVTHQFKYKYTKKMQIIWISSTAICVFFACIGLILITLFWKIYN